MQRKLYNSFYIKQETYFEKFSDKSNEKNDKFCKCLNNKEIYNQLSSSNKVHDNYLDTLKEGYTGGVGICRFSSAFVGNCGSGAATTSAATAAHAVIKASISTFSLDPTKFSNILSGESLLYKSSIQSAITSGVKTSINISLVADVASGAAVKVASASFFSYGIAALVLILIPVVIIILYIWLRKRRLMFLI